MSVYAIRNKFLDPYDPYWLCRLLSLKVGTLMILMSFCNAFLKSPEVPMFFMLATVMGTAATELLPAKTKLKKILVLFSIIFVLSTAGMLWGVFSYFREALFLFLMAFTYLSLRFMALNTKAAVLPSLLILFGILQLDGGAATNLTAIANTYLYYFEFGLMGAITVLFFPDFTVNIFKSAFIRILESNIARLNSKDLDVQNGAFLSALNILRAKAPVLGDQYQALYASIVEFQHAFTHAPELNARDQELTKSVLSTLITAVNKGQSYPWTCDSLAQLAKCNAGAYTALKKLIDGYNPCRA